MYDLQVLAYQTDMTRVITFMTGREFGGRTYREIGIPDGHHSLTHHEWTNRKRSRRSSRSTRTRPRHFAYFLK